MRAWLAILTERHPEVRWIASTPTAGEPPVARREIGGQEVTSNDNDEVNG